MVIKSHCGFNSPDNKHPEFADAGLVVGLLILFPVGISFTFPTPEVALKVKFGVVHKGIDCEQSAFMLACENTFTENKNSEIQIIIFFMVLFLSGY